MSFVGNYMKKYYYDFHMHSALSPCAENEMTPQNMIKALKDRGFDAFALTDHNSARNVRAFDVFAKKEKIIFVPGIEVESVEGIHIVTLFPSVDACEEMGNFVYENLVSIKNDVDIFGEQLVFDDEGKVIDEEEFLLITSTAITIDVIFEKAEELGGVAIFAHLERDSYSVVSNLGFVPVVKGKPPVEISVSDRGDDFLEQYPEYNKYKLLRSSDSHRLSAFKEKLHFIELDKEEKEVTAFDFVEWIKKG